MRIIPTTILCFLLSTSAHAGFNALTIHSRANCVNNESISWDARKSYMLTTTSYHYTGGALKCTVSTGWETTWRSAAVHWGEGKGGWTVKGEHWIFKDGRAQFLGNETVTNCSIYDGWWNKK